MKTLEFLSIIFFLLACTAGEDSYGLALLFLILAGNCAVLSSAIPERKKKTK